MGQTEEEVESRFLGRPLGLKVKLVMTPPYVVDGLQVPVSDCHQVV